MSGSVQVKKIISLIILISTLLCSCSAPQKSVENKLVETESQYIKAIWISYYELSEFTSNKSEKEFTQSISKSFDNLNNQGFNTVIVQVRPCADAFYKSDIFPVSIYFNGIQGGEMDYDPLQIMCECAKSSSLRIEAWINPYRVSQDDDISKLCEDNIAAKWLNNDDKKSNVVVCDNKIFFSPASDDVKKIVIKGVEEIVKNYDIDGIHFDDYFYPTTDESIDENEFLSYKESGGNLLLDDWRRENVSDLIKKVYSTVKKIKPQVVFGVSPASNIEKNYNTLYADVEKWVREDGYIDYICPQIYFGFKNVYQPFMQTVKKWKKLCENTSTTLYIGLPLYKSGEVDDYASTEDDEAKNEFVNNSNIIARQIRYIEKIERIKGYFVFSYSYLEKQECEEEVSQMYEAMQDSNLLLRLLPIQ